MVRPASTVVLLRDGHEGLETFLVRRHDAVAFMGGAHVFPGGRVDDSDAAPAYAAYADGALSSRFSAPVASVRAHYVAAARELFEEAGILLARDPARQFVSLEPDDNVRALRLAITTGDMTLLDLLRQFEWRLSFDALVYFAHWVTPPVEARRYDTRFFLAAVPPAQDPAHDASETVDSVWLRPAEAIRRCRDGALALPPPTWTTLRALESFGDVGSALAWGREQPAPRIEPSIEQRGDTRIVILPHVEGFAVREQRFLLADGRWLPVEPAE
jgi:8-oxo-dGTP pyrophosphatase MutT (NUDIX family)